jgi:hypothetical protein
MHPEMYCEFIHCMFRKCGVLCEAKMEKNVGQDDSLLFMWTNTEVVHLSLFRS